MLAAAPMGDTLFYFEERSWLSQLLYMDGVQYRKRAKMNGYFETRVDSWGLDHEECTRGSNDDDSFRANLVSTKLLIAWMFQKCRQLRQGNSWDRCAPC